MSPVLVIILASIGIVAQGAFLVWVSPLPTRKTIAIVSGVFVALAGITYAIEQAEFAFARAADISNWSHTPLPWWTFPMLSTPEMVLVYSAITIAGIWSGYVMVRVIRKGMRNV